MSKELSPLKAFKKVREQNDFLKERNIPKEYRYDDELDVIETALKDYKRVMVEKNNLFKRWTKEHQALEIIKEKRVNIFVLIESKDVNVYNYHLKTHRFQFEKYLLTQEEFDFLREVL